MLSGHSGQTPSDDPYRLSDAQLVTYLRGFLTGFENCRTTSTQINLAVATNSAGNFDNYPAVSKGTDWADNVIAPLYNPVHSDLAVIGADDIASDYDATEIQAEQW